MNGLLKRFLTWLLRPIIEEVAWEVLNGEEHEEAETEFIRKVTKQ